jgi:hypothetical protein
MRRSLPWAATLLLALALALSGLTGCSFETKDASVEVVRGAHGRGMGDYPSYHERLVLYGSNRARSDPAAAGWDRYAAQPPLQWDYQLNRAARAHSIDMRDTPCFQHSSCDGTDPFVRIRSYYQGDYRIMGENIAAGSKHADGLLVVEHWINEVGAQPGTTGHRDVILSGSFTHLGAGYAPGGSRYQGYWTQNLVGTGEGVSRPRMTDGIHFPAAVAPGGVVTFGTTYYDARGTPANRVAVVIEGECALLARARGVPAHATYEGSVALGEGCHRYHFVATAGDIDWSYPDSGSLQVGIGAAAALCPLVVASRVDTRCRGGAVPADGGGGAVEGGGGGGARDGGVADGGGGAGADVGPGGVAPLPPPAAQDGGVPPWDEEGVKPKVQGGEIHVAGGCRYAPVADGGRSFTGPLVAAALGMVLAATRLRPRRRRR